MKIISKLIATFKIILGGGIRSHCLNQGLNYDTSISTSNGGHIVLEGKIHSRKRCTIRSSGNLTIGNNVSLNENVYIVCHQEIKIGNDVIIGPNVVIVDHDHDYSAAPIRSNGYRNKAITIGSDVWIGANVVILKGTVIGNHCVIGAGTVVKTNIPDNTLAYQERAIVSRRI